MNPVLGAILLGVGAFAIYQLAFAGAGTKINVVGGSRFWDNSLAPALKKRLAGLKATPGPVERTWMLAATGTESALARVQSIQASGSFAVTTDNLLAGGGAMGLSQVLAIEPLKDLAPAGGTVAVLPAIA